MIPIVSNICALPEFVSHQKNGFLIRGRSHVDLENTLIYLIDHPELFDKFSYAARHKYQQSFSLSLFQKKLFKVFKNSLGVNCS